MVDLSHCYCPFNWSKNHCADLEKFAFIVLLVSVIVYVACVKPHPKPWKGSSGAALIPNMPMSISYHILE